LHDSVALVVYLIRKNPTQEEAAAIFYVSQSTVSRRWDLPRPLIGKVLACEIPHPSRIGGTFGTYLVDGTRLRHDGTSPRAAGAVRRRHGAPLSRGVPRLGRAGPGVPQALGGRRDPDGRDR
jgi:hypothetical protein